MKIAFSLLLLLLAGCASQTKNARTPSNINYEKRARTDLESLRAYSPGKVLSTCSQFGLATEQQDKYINVSTGLSGLNLSQIQCEYTNAVGICNKNPHPDSEVKIYTDIYYYSPGYTKETAKALCELDGGFFVWK